MAFERPGGLFDADAISGARKAVKLKLSECMARAAEREAKVQDFHSRRLRGDGGLAKQLAEARAALDGLSVSLTGQDLCACLVPNPTC